MIITRPRPGRRARRLGALLLIGWAAIAGAAPARSEVYETPRYILAVLFGSCETCPAYQVVVVDKQKTKSAVVVPEVLPDTGDNAPGAFSTMTFAADGSRFRVERTFDNLEVTDSATGAAVRQKLVGHDAPMIGYDGKGRYFIIEMPASDAASGGARLLVASPPQAELIEGGQGADDDRTFRFVDSDRTTYTIGRIKKGDGFAYQATIQSPSAPARVLQLDVAEAL